MPHTSITAKPRTEQVTCDPQHIRPILGPLTSRGIRLIPLGVLAVSFRPAGIVLTRFSFLLAAVGCGGSDLVLPGPDSPAASGAPAVITIVGGNRQSGAPGTVLRDSVVVKVTDSAGNPLAGMRVEFVATAPGATVTPGGAFTNSDGIAGARWVVGPGTGTQLLVARVVGSGTQDGIETAFEASVRSAKAATIRVAGGDNQSGAVGTALTAPLIVLVTDQFGNPIDGEEVSWDAQEGRINPSSSRTGPDGLAVTSWVLGPNTGSQSATASVEGLVGSPVTFTSTAVAGSASGLVRVSGNNQSGRPGEKLDQPLVIRLVDKEGNGIPDRAVTWVVGVGGGTVPSATTLTDASGEARTRWTLGPTAGSNTLSAVVSGVGIVAFTATATGGGGGGGGGNSTPTRMRFAVQPTDVEHKHGIISPPVVVEVLDQNGNRVTDREFTIRLDLIKVNTGRSMGHEQAETRSGVATYPDLHINVVGEFLLRATAPGLPTVDSDHFVTHE